MAKTAVNQTGRMGESLGDAVNKVLSKLAAILQVLNPNCFCLIRISVLDHYPHTSTVFKLPNRIRACCTLSCLIRQASAVIPVNKADIMCLFIIGRGGALQATRARPSSARVISRKFYFGSHQPSCDIIAYIPSSLYPYPIRI